MPGFPSNIKMDGDKDDIPTQATPQSTDTLSSVSELESEWLKLKFDFLGLPTNKLDLIATGLPGRESFADLRNAAIDDSFNTTVPSFLCSSPEATNGAKKESIRCISFLHEALGEKQVVSRDSDFLVVSRKQIIVYGLPPYGEGRSFMEKIRLIDESPTEKLLVARFILSASAPFRIAAGGRDGVVKIITPEVPSARYGLMGHRHTIRDLKPLDDPDFLLSCSDDLSIRFWNIKTRVQIALFQGILAHTDSIRSLDLHHSQSLFVSAGFDRCVQLWSIDDKVATAKALSKVWNTEFNVTGGVRCCRKRFETKLVTQSVFFSFKVHTSKVCAVKFYHDLVVSQDKTNKVCVWQPSPGRGACSVLLVHSLQPLGGIRSEFALNTVTGLLACAGDPGEILLWNLLSPAVHPTVLKKPFHVAIKGLSFSSDGSVLVGRCKDGLLIRFDVWS